MKKRYVIYWHDQYEPWVQDCATLENLYQAILHLKLRDDIIRKIGEAKVGEEINPNGADRIFVLRG